MVSYIYDSIKNNMLYFSLENKWFSTGFPSNPAWGWNKARPKISLYDIGMAHTANSFMLNLVEFVHWTPIIPNLTINDSVPFSFKLVLSKFFKK